MNKITRVMNTEVARFEGYMNAAQPVFAKGGLQVFFGVAVFAMLADDATEEDIVLAYKNSNPIAYRFEVTLSQMTERLNQVMTMAPNLYESHAVTNWIETELRAGFWKHLEACFDYKDARIIEVGPDVPFVEMGDGVTYVLYRSNQCLLLIANMSD